MTEHKAEHCMVCAEALIYHDRAQEVRCDGCGHQGQSAIVCPAGHYVCDACHSGRTLQRLHALAAATSGRAPEDILEQLLSLPDLPMHGPEHHAMAGLALLLACQRAGAKLPENYVAETIRRSMQIPGGTCGYHGACGGAVSMGVAVSILTGATPVTGPARGMAHRATAMALQCCGDNHSRCCKRALRKTVAAGRVFFAAELGIGFPQPVGQHACKDVARNRECAKRQCRYFHGTQESG